jgi:hypothetical protein
LSAAGRSTPKFLAKACDGGRVDLGQQVGDVGGRFLAGARAAPGDFEGGGQIGHGAKARLAQRLGLRGEAGK